MADTISGPSGNCVENTSGTEPGPGSSLPDLSGDCTEGAGYELWTEEPDNSIQLNFPSDDDRACLRALPGGLVAIFACTGNDDEIWTWTGSNNHELINKGAGSCLTAEGVSNQLEVMSCTQSGQSWTFNENPTTQGASAATSLLGMYNSNTGLLKDQFITQSNPCNISQDSFATSASILQMQYRGNCWWWSAVSLSSLITFDEQASETTWTLKDSAPPPAAATLALITATSQLIDQLPLFGQP